MFGKNMYLVLAITIVLAVSGVAAWLLWNELPEKIPVRSMQVLLTTESDLAYFGKYNIGLGVYTMIA
ncbi:putative membrane protein [Propionispora sp. 2/2-37]|uniref:hypothetical protein n=1 Tax=Propionispora sp. 2/2-37 TaxID=1677858 RepID=UPI0006BB5AA5|nr:hypothetical protein [Propionispora sp. 2/2-37]CUH94056.1 putative membrane protein [Propionispora sp. 2/2-37]